METPLTDRLEGEPRPSPMVSTERMAKESPIFREYGVQQELVARLHAVITEAELEVEPVLTPDLDGDTPTDVPEEHPGSQVLLGLRDSNRRLRGAITRLEGLIARVEV